MLCYTIGVVVVTLGTTWFVEDLVKIGFQKIQLIYAVCIIFGLVLMSLGIGYKKSGR